MLGYILYSKGELHASSKYVFYYSFSPLHTWRLIHGTMHTILKTQSSCVFSEQCCSINYRYSITLGSWDCEFINMHSTLFWYDCVNAIFIWHIHSIVLQYDNSDNMITVFILYEPHNCNLLKRKLFLHNFIHLNMSHGLMKPKHT